MPLHQTNNEIVTRIAPRLKIKMGMMMFCGSTIVMIGTFCLDFVPKDNVKWGIFGP